MDKIKWTNQKAYDNSILNNRIEFVKKHMNGLLPLYGKEKQYLIAYANKHKIPPDEMFSIRNTIKIQKEIDQSRFYKNVEPIIKKNFSKLVDSLKSDHTNSHVKIRHFFKSTKMPIMMAMKTIRSMNEYKSLSLSDINYLDKIQNVIYQKEIDSQKKSREYEIVIEDFLQDKFKFRTENDIKKDGDYNVTPDILFDENILLEINGLTHQIRWLDAKNYILTNTPFIIRSLKKQAEKYNNIFGEGAFVFHYGFDSSIKIPGAIMLDGPNLQKN